MRSVPKNLSSDKQLTGLEKRTECHGTTTPVQCRTCLELGVDRIDLSIRAVLSQQRLREEAREAIQGLLQSFHLHLEPWNQLEPVGISWNQLEVGISWNQ